jgi:hypothetical protein
MEEDMRPGMILLGIGLGLLWLAGLYNHATSWLVWLTFASAILSLLFGLMPETVSGAAPGKRSGTLMRMPPFVQTAVLLVLWIIGLASGATSWLTWWTFAFAIAYGLLGLGTSLPESRAGRPTVTGPRPA